MGEVKIIAAASPTGNLANPINVKVTLSPQKMPMRYIFLNYYVLIRVFSLFLFRYIPVKPSSSLQSLGPKGLTFAKAIMGMAKTAQPMLLKRATSEGSIRFKGLTMTVLIVKKKADNKAKSTPRHLCFVLLPFSFCL